MNTQTRAHAQQTSSLIKQIDQDSIRFIAAGEKINDIETAIRELIENSIDAEAKNIEIRLARFGIDAIEVEDNGFGIDEKNFDSLGIRYHTSKINDYKKLQNSLKTFGFRGEALSCLCNISNVTITTKTKLSPTGWKLIFKKDGTINKKERVGRDHGTTVIVKNLFQSLPVRKRQLETNAKKQYDKIVKLVYEHVLARPHIKFTLCKKNAAKKEKDFTHGGSTLEGCIITIYGIKLQESLIPIKQASSNKTKMMETEMEIKTAVEEGENNQAENNSSNSRDIITNQESNSSNNNACVIPHQDKGEELKLTNPTANAPSSGEFFKRSRRTRPAREPPEYKIYGYISKVGLGRNSTDCQFLFINKKPCDIPRLSRLINETYKNYSRDQYPFYCLFIEVQNWAADFNVPRKRAVILQEEDKLCDIVRESLEEMYSPLKPASQRSCPIAQIPMLSMPKQNGSSSNSINVESKDEKSTVVAAIENGPSPAHVENEAPRESHKLGPNVESIPDLFEHSYSKRARTTTPNKPTNNRSPLKNSTAGTSPLPGFRSGLDVLIEEADTTNQKNGANNDASIKNSSVSSTNKQTVSPGTGSKKVASPNKPVPPPLPPCRFQQVEMIQNGDLKVRIEYLEDLGTALEQERAQRKTSEDSKQFSFAIHPKFNTVAEEQLKFNLDKKSFQDMQILGQFNRGFIITRLNKHIFIIDQHATDERANYEDQLDKSPLEKQVMVHPKPLFLNLIQENAILNNMDAFAKRGFEFTVNKENLLGYRVMLTSTSICKGVGKDEYLGKEDIEELIDVITESPSRLESYTLKKVRDVAASRACRKSVMIGDSLTWQQMSSIVEKMANLQNPWVCAHNRPTIRHLMDIDWMNP